MSKSGVFTHGNANLFRAVSKTRGFAYGIHLPCVKPAISHTGFIFAGAVCKTRGFAYEIHLPCAKPAISHTGTSFLPVPCVKHGVLHTGFICRV